MLEFSPMRLLRIYVGENSSSDGKPTYEHLVHEAKRQGLHGATAYRGVLGFGANSRIRTAKILRLSEDLPMVVEIVDAPERINAFLETVDAHFTSGAVVLQDVQAHVPDKIEDDRT